MSTTTRPKRIAGWVLHGLIGLLMIVSGVMKLVMKMPPEMEQSPLNNSIALIGVGEVASALLLLIPRTMSLGTWLTSAFWGGAICLHMSKGEPYVAQSVLLLLTWAGAWLRDVRSLASFLPVEPARAVEP